MGSQGGSRKEGAGAEKGLDNEGAGSGIRTHGSRGWLQQEEGVGSSLALFHFLAHKVGSLVSRTA